MALGKTAKQSWKNPRHAVTQYLKYYFKCQHLIKCSPRKLAASLHRKVAKLSEPHVIIFINPRATGHGFPGAQELRIGAKIGGQIMVCDPRAAI